VGALRATLTTFHEQPRSGSAAAAVQTDADLRIPMDIAAFLMMATDDYLDALGTLLMPRMADGGLARYIHRYAAYPLLRAAGESAAQAAWLLEPGLAHEARHQRALGIWLHSAQQQLKLGSDHPTAGERIRKLRADAAARGYPEFPASPPGTLPIDGKKVGHFGQARPNATDQFKNLSPNGDTLYRFLSAPTHATLYSMIENSRSTPTDSPGMAMSITTVNVSLLLTVTQATLRLVDVAMGWWCEYAGYESGTWLHARRAVTSL
jgi:hypothetical protein